MLFTVQKKGPQYLSPAPTPCRGAEPDNIFLAWAAKAETSAQG